MDVRSEACDMPRLRCAVSDAMLVLIVEAIAKLLKMIEPASPPITKPA
jgi:hypothetical protein